MLPLAKALVANQTGEEFLMFRFNKVTARLAKRFTPQTMATYMQAVTRFQGGISERALRLALASGNIQAIEAAVGPSRFGQMMRRLEKPLRSTAAAAGTASAQILEKGGFPMQFNAFHPNVVLFARDQAATLVTGITKDVRVAIRTVVALGAQEGLTVVQQARAIREVVALPGTWAKAPLTLHKEILDGQISKATRRRLSGVDKQLIRSRIQRGTATPAFARRMQARYAKSLINSRALAIAQHETLRAANFGQQQSWVQAIQQKALPQNSRRFWLVTADDRLSQSHAEIPGMNPDGVGMEEEFDTPEGSFDFPPIRARCRCGVGLGIGPDTGASAPSVGPPLLDRAVGVPQFMQQGALESVRIAKQAGVKLTTRGTSATLRQRETAALMAQGAKDVKALGFDLSKLKLNMKGSSKVQESVFTPKPGGKSEIVMRNRSGAEWHELTQRNKIGSPPWAASDDIVGAAHHELGHALHHSVVGDTAQWNKLNSWVNFKQPPQATLNKVSKFASNSPQEYVAEVFRGLTSGRVYPKEVLQLYEKLKGPVAPQWRKMFDDILGGKKVKVSAAPPVTEPLPPPPGSVPRTISGGPIQPYIENPTRTIAQMQADMEIRTGAKLFKPRSTGLATNQTAALTLQGAEDIKALGFDLSGIRFKISTNIGDTSWAGTYAPAQSLVEVRVTSIARVGKEGAASFRAKWHPSDSWGHTVQHELGHALHHKGFPAGYNKLRIWPGEAGGPPLSPDKVRPLFSSGEGRRIAGEVSKYAKTNPHEFVAEMFQGLVSGARYSDNAMRLYVELRGPISPRWKKAFDRVTKKKRARVKKEALESIDDRYKKFFGVNERRSLASGETNIGKVRNDRKLMDKMQEFRKREMQRGMKESGLSEADIAVKLSQYEGWLKEFGFDANSLESGILKWLSEKLTGGVTVHHRNFIDNVKSLRAKFLRKSGEDLINLSNVSQGEGVLMMRLEQQINTAMLSNGGAQKTIRLYRGVADKYFRDAGLSVPGRGAKGSVQVNSISSWSTDRGTARSFARGMSGGPRPDLGVVMQVDVPIEFVFASHRSALRLFLHGGEEEFMLFGKKLFYKII